MLYRVVAMYLCVMCLVSHASNVWCLETAHTDTSNYPHTGDDTDSQDDDKMTPDSHRQSERQHRTRLVTRSERSRDNLLLRLQQGHFHGLLTPDN